MGADAALTQGLSLTWRPSLEFYEARVRLLRPLRDAGVLRQFRLDENSVTARLTRGRRLVIGVTSLLLQSFNGPLPADTEAHLEHVVELLQPRVTSATLLLQHIVPLHTAATYQDACRAAARGFLGGLAEDTGMSAVAVLVDGRAAVPAVSYQAEFGVINQAEAPGRLARVVGRTSGPAVEDDLDQLIGREYPPLAVFVDSTWMTNAVPEEAEAVPAWFTALSRDVNKEASELVDVIHRRVEEAVASLPAPEEEVSS